MTNRLLRVAVASSGLGHVTRGIEAWASDLGHALHHRGVDVSLWKGAGEALAPLERTISCWNRNSRCTRWLLSLLPRRFFWRVGLGSPYGVEQTTFALNLLGHLRRQRIDILHVQDPQVALITQIARRLGFVRARTILAHGTEEDFDFLRKIDYLQHLAPWHLEQARSAGVWSPAWTAIPNFIDTDVFHPGSAEGLRAELNIPRDAFVVVTAAAIKRNHKRIDYLLDEFSRLLVSRPTLSAVLVVAGGRESETDELIALGQRQLGNRVRFLVRFPRERMPDLYRLADTFVLCSLREMMPIALLEATATGVPCVVHRHPIMEWMAGPGGRTIDMTTPGALAGELLRLSADPRARIHLGGLARAHCLEHFGRDSVVDKILEYYRFVFAHQRGGARAGRSIRVQPRVGAEAGVVPAS